MKELQNLKVDIKTHTKVLSSSQLPNGQQELTLSNGSKFITDMYVPTFGLIPNSSYVPSKFLHTNGSVAVDQYLMVKGTKDVWAVGDITAGGLEPAQFIYADRQSAHLVKNLVLALSNRTPLPYKPATSRTKSLLFLFIVLANTW